MAPWQQAIEAAVRADGVITAAMAATIQREILADRTVTQAEIDFLFSLRASATSAAPEFHQFVFAIVQKKILPDNEITAFETAWLERTLFADGRVDALERRFLKQLKEAVLVSCPEFDALCAKYESI